MGLRVSVYTNPTYRHCADSRRGGTGIVQEGVTVRHDELTVVNVSGPSDPDPARAPAVMLVANPRGTVALVPAFYDGDGWVEYKAAGKIGPMFGGNYAGTSDSRFGDAVRRLTGGPWHGAVCVHDRYETVADYERLSR